MYFSSVIKQISISFIIFCCAINSHAEKQTQPLPSKDKLIFAAEIIRHGDRTPSSSLPTAPYDWPEGLGELTAIGMKQEFELGKKFREYYIIEQKLLPESYQPSTLYVRSSNFNRTLMSAQSVLLGLYPIGAGPKLSNNQYALPKGFQPIPIHTINVDQDDLLVAHDTKRAEFDNLVMQLIYNSQEWQDKNKQLNSKFKQWSEKLNIPIHNLTDVFPIGDNLYIRQLHHAPMPPELNQHDIDEIIHWGIVTQAIQYQPKAIGILTGKDLLIEIQNKMQEKINSINNSHKSNTADFILYSGHDISLLAFLSVIGAPAEINPPYASHISVRLFKKINANSYPENQRKSNNNSYYFTVLLNNQAVSIPACNNGNTCTLSQLNTIVDQIG